MIFCDIIFFDLFILHISVFSKCEFLTISVINFIAVNFAWTNIVFSNDIWFESVVLYISFLTTEIIERSLIFRLFNLLVDEFKNVFLESMFFFRIRVSEKKNVFIEKDPSKKSCFFFIWISINPIKYVIALYSFWVFLQLLRWCSGYASFWTSQFKVKSSIEDRIARKAKFIATFYWSHIDLFTFAIICIK